MAVGPVRAALSRVGFLGTRVWWKVVFRWRYVQLAHSLRRPPVFRESGQDVGL